MKHSESILAIAKALPQAQKAIKTAKKDVENTFFKSKYADLASVIEACKEALNANGISFLQGVRTTDDGIIVETMLLHESGEWFSEELALPVAKHDAQGIGSAISYGKRYGLQAIVGVPSEDDDGNNAAKNAPAKKEPVIGNKKPGESEQAYLNMTPESQKFCDEEAAKLIEAAKTMNQVDLAAFYNIQNYDDEEMLAINYALREHPPVRGKIKDGRDIIRSKAIGAAMATQA